MIGVYYSCVSGNLTARVVLSPVSRACAVGFPLILINLDQVTTSQPVR